MIIRFKQSTVRLALPEFARLRHVFPKGGVLVTPKESAATVQGLRKIAAVWPDGDEEKMMALQLASDIETAAARKENFLFR